MVRGRSQNGIDRRSRVSAGAFLRGAPHRMFVAHASNLACGVCRCLRLRLPSAAHRHSRSRS
ncbi:hypothetical protein WG70_10115 [Burkholderia oklahomensis EO147]|nr:hypothetical protein WG70_10115 [Burkholderia oklahomensis EO147]AOI49622.1 hypothetical protein WI23_28190 [Burkholderia oklahomensis C6786]KUY55650.1 hypothetical protein WI23_20535 [Burkholderia oklahomensis C6786]KUY62102.1 hypothetical protein WG70_05215 [Burkholderia oklahomensis EO147]